MHPMKIVSFRKLASVCLGIFSFALIALFLALPAHPQNRPDAFLEKPYLQLGDAPGLSDPESMLIVWQSPDRSSGWQVEVKSGSSWKAAEEPVAHRIAVQGVDPHIVWTARVSDLKPGAAPASTHPNRIVLLYSAIVRQAHRQKGRLLTRLTKCSRILSLLRAISCTLRAESRNTGRNFSPSTIPIPPLLKAARLSRGPFCF